MQAKKPMTFNEKVLNTRILNTFWKKYWYLYFSTFWGKYWYLYSNTNIKYCLIVWTYVDIRRLYSYARSCVLFDNSIFITCCVSIYESCLLTHIPLDSIHCSDERTAGVWGNSLTQHKPWQMYAHTWYE